MKLAVIGCGYWGPNLIRNLYQLPEEHQVMCCDQDKAKLARMRRLFPAIEATTQFNDIITDPEVKAVLVATPVHTHHKLGEAALKHGKHLFVEKPLANSVENALRLVDLAHANSRVLMVGHTFEYTAAVNKIKEIIESGLLGEVLYVSSTRVNLGLFQPDINVVWDLAPHDISIMNYVLGMAPVAVNAQGKAHYKKGIEDVATVSLNYDNGVIAFIHVSWLDPNKIRRTTFVGSKKMLVYNDVEVQEKIKIYDKGVDAPPYYDTYAEFQFSYRYGDIHIPRVEEYEPLRHELAHFIECIKERKTPRSDGYSGLRVVSVLEAAEHSIKNSGKFVPINHRDPLLQYQAPGEAPDKGAVAMQSGSLWPRT
jgi:predicted dehydrogenase